MKHSGRVIGNAVVADKYEFDIFDAIDARDAYNLLKKAMQDSVEVDEYGKANQNPIVISPELATCMSMLLSKLAAPALRERKNGHCGLFEPMDHEAEAKPEQEDEGV